MNTDDIDRLFHARDAITETLVNALIERVTDMLAEQLAARGHDMSQTVMLADTQPPREGHVCLIPVRLISAKLNHNPDPDGSIRLLTRTLVSEPGQLREDTERLAVLLASTGGSGFTLRFGDR